MTSPRPPASASDAAPQHERLFALAQDILCIASADGHFKVVNPAFSEILGWSREELLARPFTDFVHPDDLEATLREVERQVVAGEKILSFDNRYRHKDGSWRHLSWKSTPSEGGFMNATARDVTEQRKAEEALRLSEQNLAVTLQSIGDAVLTTDAQRRVTRLNPVAELLTGWKETEATGKPVEEVFRIINEHTRKPAVIPVDDVLATGAVHGLANHTVLIARDGKERPIADSAAPIRDRDGTIMGVVLCFRDVTKESRARALDAARAEVLERLVGADSLDEIFAILLRHVERIFPGQPASILLVDDSGHLQHAASTGLPGFYNEAIEGLAIGPTVGSCGEAASTGRLSVAADLETHPNWAPYLGLTRRARLRACWSQPMIGEDARVLGTLAVYSHDPKSPKKRDVRLLDEIARLAALALQRRKAETALRESEERHRLLIEASRDAMMTTHPPSWRFTSCNPAGLKLFGIRDEKELTALGPWDVSPTHQPDGSPSADKALAAITKAMEEGSDFFEWMHRRLDGTTFPATVLLTRMELAGQPFIQATVRDITVRKIAEEALRHQSTTLERQVAERTAELAESERRHRMLIANLRGMVYRCLNDSEWTMEFASQGCQELFGFAPEEFTSGRRTYAGVVHPDDLPRLSQACREALESHTSLHSEYRIVLPTGQTKWVREQACGIYRGDGTVEAIEGLITDITEQKLTELALRIISTELTSLSGAPLYETVTRRVAELLEVEWCFVCRWSPAQPDLLHTIAMTEDGKSVPDFSHALAGTPCAAVPEHRSLVIERHVRQLYPQDHYLVEKQVESYVGQLLCDNQGHAIGHLGIMSRRPLTASDRALAVLKLFAIAVAAEMERQRAQGRFADLFEFAPDAIIMTDREGVITQANKQAEAMFGWDRGELVGCRVEVLIPEADRLAHTSLREEFTRSAVSRSMGLDRPGLRALRKDGTRFPVEISLSPMETEDGIMVAAAIRDISQRVKSEQEMRQALATLDAMEDAALLFDPDTLQFLRANQGASRLLGYSVEDILQMRTADIKPAFDEALFRGALRQLLDGEVRAHTFTTHFRHQEGRDIPVEMTLQYIASTGERPHCIWIARDITRRLEMEKQVNRSQRLEAIGTLAGGVAHDLNNVLAPILMGVEFMRMKYPAAADILDRFETSANRGAGMVRQLLTFAKGAEGERVSVQPGHLLKELKDIMLGTFPKNIQVEVICSTALPTVLGDPTQLQQILLNLCVNARDAMPTGGLLTVEAESMEVDATYATSVPDAKPGKYVALRVKDTGTGIAPEILDRIFDPFFTTKAPDKGTGLGLSTVMGIVKSHGGFLQVTSWRGRGSTFTAHLPAELITTGAVPAYLKHTFSGNGETILLVDDESSMLDVGQTVLTELNFKVLTAADGAEGFVKVVQHREALRAIITDMHMPHMDGLALIRAVRRVLPEIPVMIGSGRLDDTIAEELKSLGVTHRLDKPYTQHMLTRMLAELLDGTAGPRN